MQYSSFLEGDIDLLSKSIFFEKEYFFSQEV